MRFDSEGGWETLSPTTTTTDHMELVALVVWYRMRDQWNGTALFDFDRTVQAQAAVFLCMLSVFEWIMERFGLFF